MGFAVFILTVLTLFMVGGAIPVAGGEQLAIFRTPVFVLLLAAFLLVNLWPRLASVLHSYA